MGVYPNHGVEYWIEIDETVDIDAIRKGIERVQFETNLNIYATKTKGICVLSTSCTDDRLVKSKYFEDNKDDWFHVRTCMKEWREPIQEQSQVDIDISNSEMNVIKKLREEFGEHISFEGWFDVNTIGYSW